MPDRYMNIRCSCCGQSWDGHPTDTFCARYRPTDVAELDRDTKVALKANAAPELLAVEAKPSTNGAGH